MRVAVPVAMVMKGSAMIFLTNDKYEARMQAEKQTINTQERQMFTTTPMQAITNINFPSISRAPPWYHVTVLP